MEIYIVRSASLAGWQTPFDFSLEMGAIFAMRRVERKEGEKTMGGKFIGVKGKGDTVDFKTRKGKDPQWS
jgi:hypothetical protein